MAGRSGIYYLPISDPDILLEGCETLLKNLFQRLVENHINGFSSYSDELNVIRVNTVKIETEFCKINALKRHYLLYGS